MAETLWQRIKDEDNNFSKSAYNKDNWHFMTKAKVLSIAKKSISPIQVPPVVQCLSCLFCKPFYYSSEVHQPKLTFKIFLLNWL